MMTGEEGAPIGAHPDESRMALLPDLAEVEAQIRQAESARKRIGQAAGAMRDQAHRHVSRLEGAGMILPENQDAYQQALEDRRICDVVSGLTAD